LIPSRGNQRNPQRVFVTNSPLNHFDGNHWFNLPLANRRNDIQPGTSQMLHQNINTNGAGAPQPVWFTLFVRSNPLVQFYSHFNLISYL